MTRHFFQTGAGIPPAGSHCPRPGHSGARVSLREQERGARARLLMRAPEQIQMHTEEGYGRNAAHVTQSHLQQAQKSVQGCAGWMHCLPARTGAGRGSLGVK